MADKDNLLTTDEFNAKVRAWSAGVRAAQTQNLAGAKHQSKASAGYTPRALESSLKGRFKSNYTSGPISRIGFSFLRYGAFVEYGAGRGYVVHEGVIRRGFRLWNAKKQEWHNTSIAAAYMAKGESSSRLKRGKAVEDGAVMRHPLPWFDKAVSANINTLADLAAEFWGDSAMRNVLDNFGKRLTIRKK